MLLLLLGLLFYPPSLGLDVICRTRAHFTRVVSADDIVADCSQALNMLIVLGDLAEVEDPHQSQRSPRSYM
jgi:hypothetical protein